MPPFSGPEPVCTNIGTGLVLGGADQTDCFSGDFDEAVVISNDSDLVLPIETVKSKFGKRVGVINPHRRKRMSSHLRRAASYHVGAINKSVLAKCQFPASLPDAQGRVIVKPASW